jgi:hypothetical protein
MKTTFFAILTLLSAFAASAATITYNFSTPSNTGLGSYMHNFASSPTGYTITAYGFENSAANDLYIKNQGSSETGLGLAHQNNFEIDNHGLVVFDISNLDSATFLQLKLGSVDQGESFAVYGLASGAYSGGTTAPKLPAAALFTGGSSLDDVYFSVPNFSSYQYLAVTAPAGNVLVEGITANFGAITNLATPEPAPMGLVGLALVGVALARRKAVRQRA